MASTTQENHPSFVLLQFLLGGHYYVPTPSNLKSSRKECACGPNNWLSSSSSDPFCCRMVFYYVVGGVRSSVMHKFRVNRPWGPISIDDAHPLPHDFSPPQVPSTIPVLFASYSRHFNQGKTGSTRTGRPQKDACHPWQNKEKIPPTRHETNPKECRGQGHATNIVFEIPQ